jgi:hypothetical protein
MTDVICPTCEHKFKTKQSLATHKRRYHPLQFKKQQQHDHIDNPSHHDAHHDTSEDNTSTSESDTENEEETKTFQHGNSGTTNEGTNDISDGINSLTSTQSESDVSVITPKIKPSRKRKSVKSWGHKKERRSSLANKNLCLESQKSIFDDHMNLELDVLSSIEERLKNINTTLKKIVSETKTPWSRLDVFGFKQHYFPNLEECSQHLFSKPVKDVLTETQNNFIDAVESEKSLTDLTILLNENKQLFTSILDRFTNCDKNINNKKSPVNYKL